MRTKVVNEICKSHLLLKVLTLFILFSSIAPAAQAQRFLTDYDSTLFIRDTIPNVVRKYENLSISGYMQPQFQVAQSEGAPSFNGGNFSEFSDNRFMLRRARVKIDYQLPQKGKKLPMAVFTYQIDATERGVNTRDMFVRLYEPTKQDFSLAMGVMARPFGYEVNLSSSVREAPERGRMSQILMTSERDLGAMITYQPQSGKKNLPIKFDIGVFNGQGLSGTRDFDSYKDIISRLTIRPIALSKDVRVSGGLSLLNGGWRQSTQYKYEMASANGNSYFKVDSSISNIGGKASRTYQGADIQLSRKNRWGKTEIRAEYWYGTQPGTATTTLNPGNLPAGPTYLRKFDGAFLMFLQNVINNKNQVIVKYDWYDPNTNVSSNQIGKAATNLTEADIKFSTLGVGFLHYFNEHLKLVLYYDNVRNETTLLPGYTQDLKDNVFTCRFHLMF